MYCRSIFSVGNFNTILAVTCRDNEYACACFEHTNLHVQRAHMLTLYTHSYIVICTTMIKVGGGGGGGGGGGEGQLPPLPPCFLRYWSRWLIATFMSALQAHWKINA